VERQDGERLAHLIGYSHFTNTVLVISQLTVALAPHVADKVKKKYGALGHSVLTVQLERGRQGLGLSLAGHKDRSRMAVFVCGLNPNGAASRNGGIQVGDEILEVTSDCLPCFNS